MYSTVPQKEYVFFSSNMDSLLSPKSVSLMWPSESRRMLGGRNTWVSAQWGTVKNRCGTNVQGFSFFLSNIIFASHIKSFWITLLLAVTLKCAQQFVLVTFHLYMCMNKPYTSSNKYKAFFLFIFYLNLHIITYKSHLCNINYYIGTHIHTHWVNKTFRHLTSIHTATCCVTTMFSFFSVPPSIAAHAAKFQYVWVKSYAHW